MGERDGAKALGKKGTREMASADGVVRGGGEKERSGDDMKSSLSEGFFFVFCFLFFVFFVFCIVIDVVHWSYELN